MTTLPHRPITTRLPKAFFIALVFNIIWINLSEVFRYFVFIMPMMREEFHIIPDVAPMNIPVFLVWGIWDMLVILSVTTVAWFALDKFGTNLRITFLTATGIWTTIFVILWLGLFNMNLATTEIVLVALPLAWLEMVIAVFLVRIARRHVS